MAIVTILDTNKIIDTADSVQAYLHDFGIMYDFCDCSGVPLEQPANQEQVLKAFETKVRELKEQGGYVSADVVSISPSTPGLDALLEKFSREHTHSEDEVRFVIAGRGVFHINPVVSSVFSVETGPGDIINLPAGTRHWFNLCQERSITTIRLFQDSAGWTPYYTDEAMHNRYRHRLCLDRQALGVAEEIGT